MKVIHRANELTAGTRPISAAIGMFDGMHLGHQQVIRQTVADARQQEGTAVAVTFDAHPNTVVAPDRTPPLIYTLSQKLRAIDSLGIDAVLLVHFDHAFSQKPPESFVRELIGGFGRVYSLCVGANFVFGHKRRGNVELLKLLGRDLNFIVHGLAAVSLDGEVVSSTRIRQAIQSGELDTASQMLGRPHALAGEVVRGDGLGRQLGVPTANLEVSGLALPPNGVYAAHATVAGQTYRVALNIGQRPTLKQPEPRLHVEAHLLDFSGELYGQELELTFVQRLRDEQKFPSLEALKAQLQKDLSDTRKLFDLDDR